MGCGGRGKLLFIASDTSSHMRDRGADGNQRRSDGGSHIANLQAVNNLEAHWGDETSVNTKHWQRLTWSCSYISAHHRERAASRSSSSSLLLFI
ncbi:hypothetical protein CgunFtcFv8_004711 [Champsocephalus gunnari]|nr:hypothetical protein CgunFtcFv8_004711 [Champsocephalus gunnari]